MVWQNAVVLYFFLAILSCVSQRLPPMLLRLTMYSFEPFCAQHEGTCKLYYALRRKSVDDERLIYLARSPNTQFIKLKAIN